MHIAKLRAEGSHVSLDDPRVERIRRAGCETCFLKSLLLILRSTTSLLPQLPLLGII